MEPVTHVLTGACLSRSGLNRFAAYATLTMAVAAEFPDLDTLWSLGGPVTGFAHHRGMTHTFLGVPVEAAIVVAMVYALHRVRLARAERASRNSAEPAGSRTGTLASGQGRGALRAARPLTVAPVRWGRLYGLALLALLSHLLLDYTNNYGLRPFFPFDRHWYAASIVFIFDPLIFVLLLLALISPAIFRLVGAEVGAKRQPFAARGWAIAALLGVVSLWTLREVEHGRAIDLAQGESFAVPESVSAASPSPGSTSEPSALPVYRSPQRVLASPDPLSPFRWFTISDFGSFYQLGQADTRIGSLAEVDGIYSKPGRDPAVLAAEATPLGRAFLDWSPAPILSVTRPGGGDASGDEGPGTAGETLVTFRDPRFMGDVPFMHRGGRSPLTGTVLLGSGGKVMQEAMGDRVQR